MTDILIRKGNWDTDRQRQDHVRTAKEEGRLQAKKRGLKRKQGLQGSNFHLSHSVYGTLLWWPKQITIPPNRASSHKFYQPCLLKNNNRKNKHPSDTPPQKNTHHNSLLIIMHLSPPGWASLVAQLVNNLPAMQETLAQFLGWEDFVEKR